MISSVFELISCAIQHHHNTWPITSRFYGKVTQYDDIQKERAQLLIELCMTSIDVDVGYIGSSCVSSCVCSCDADSVYCLWCAIVIPIDHRNNRSLSFVHFFFVVYVVCCCCCGNNFRPNVDQLIELSGEPSWYTLNVNTKSNFEFNPKTCQPYTHKWIQIKFQHTFLSTILTFFPSFATGKTFRRDDSIADCVSFFLITFHKSMRLFYRWMNSYDCSGEIELVHLDECCRTFEWFRFILPDSFISHEKIKKRDIKRMKYQQMTCHLMQILKVVSLAKYVFEFLTYFFFSAFGLRNPH